MFRTFMTTLLVAGVIVIFVISRFLGIDSETTTQSSPEIASENYQSVYDVWVPFTSEDKDFKVKFPRPPEHISQTTRDSLNRYNKHYDIYAATGLDNAAYMLQEITFPGEKGVSKNPSILKNSLGDILASTRENLLQKTEDQKFKGVDSLYFEIENGDNYITGIMFMNKDTLYILSRTINEEDKGEEEDYNFFLNSFEINNSSKSLEDRKPKE
ncbi:MAG: hypothetical protein VX777_03535 [Chlamydiota bacterium]|nr:hypothetical protein [Chlamydiota bacterium]